MLAEIITDPLMKRGGRRMLAALIEAAPIEVKVREEYKGDCELLVIYGAGHAVRRQWWNEHRASGRHCIGWDLGYWHQEKGTMRATIDHDHPQAWLRPETPNRWDAQGIKLRNDKGTGPAVIIGMGPKSLDAFGLAPLEWETMAAQQMKALNLRCAFRPKRQEFPKLKGMPIAKGRIEKAIKGASLVVCRHSNVAVDACIAGVPVICEDGAAHALYQHGKDPTPEQRLEFLRSLAYWQWTPEEAKESWTYLLNRLCG